MCKLLDRSAFAGSIATSDLLLRVLTKEAGIPLCDAVKLLTKNTARAMRLDSKGEIKEGKDADFVIFDENVNVKGVFVGGEKRV